MSRRDNIFSSSSNSCNVLAKVVDGEASNSCFHICMFFNHMPATASSKGSSFFLHLITLLKTLAPGEELKTPAIGVLSLSCKTLGPGVDDSSASSTLTRTLGSGQSSDTTGLGAKMSLKTPCSQGSCTFGGPAEIRT